MPVSLVPTSPAVGRLLAERRRELGMSLRDVQEATTKMGRPIPFATLARIEKGQLDPGVRRMHVLRRLYGVSAELTDNVLDLEEFSGDASGDVSPGDLYSQGIRAWKEGDLRTALTRLVALRRDAPITGPAKLERQNALLSFASGAASLGKFRLAREILDGLLLEPPEKTLLARVLVETAACWHHLGSIEVAFALLARAEVHVDPNDQRQVASIHHERAAALLSKGDVEAAEKDLSRALALYRAAGDAHGEARVHGDRVRLELGRGRPEASLAAAREAREHAMRHGFQRLAVLRGIDEGRALLLLGDHRASLTALKTALGAAVIDEDAVSRFFAHHVLWKTHTALGNGSDAAMELTLARHYADRIDSAGPELEEVRMQRKRRGRPRSS